MKNVLMSSSVDMYEIEACFTINSFKIHPTYMIITKYDHICIRVLNFTKFAHFDCKLANI